MVAGQVLGCVLALAELEVGRLCDYAGAVGASVLTMGVGILHAHHYRVGHLARTWRSTILTHVADDDRAVADIQL